MLSWSQQAALHARPGAGWAGLVMTRPGHCQHCSPCPVRAVIHPRWANQRRGSHSEATRGSGHLSRALFPPSCPGLGPWTEPRLLCLQPQRGVFRALCFAHLPTPSPNALSTSALADPEGQSGLDQPHLRGDPAALPSGLTSASHSPTSLASHHLAGVPTRQSQHKRWWAECGSPWPLALHPATEWA